MRALFGKRGGHFVLQCALCVFVLFAQACQLPLNDGAAAQLQGPGESQLPARFQLGRLATPDEIAAWDIDVMPNGEGLPAGQGTALEGRAIYEVRCKSCHGPGGQGGPIDPLVGRIRGDGFPFGVDPSAPKTIGNYWPWATTIFDYTRRAMPLDRPGSLSNDEVYALTAYLLYENGLFRENKVLDGETLVTIVMPARGRFFVDDRRGGPEVR